MTFLSKKLRSKILLNINCLSKQQKHFSSIQTLNSLKQKIRKTDTKKLLHLQNIAPKRKICKTSIIIAHLKYAKFISEAKRRKKVLDPLYWTFYSHIFCQIDHFPSPFRFKFIYFHFKSPLPSWDYFKLPH